MAVETISPYSYCPSLVSYQRRRTINVSIGDVPLGSDYPIRVQSMTTVSTLDTQGSVEQVIRMVDAGCEYVRITAPNLKEAQNLEEIKNELRKRGVHVPLIADIHFTPNAAELAARIVEKVRINPGNYADRKRFEQIEYTDAAYDAELDRIRSKFTPLVKICKEYGTAMRIGTNHGSLSDRIMSRYGDTPLGMVESALEFVRICEDLGYYDLVLSMKASNPQVMIQAYRLLVQKLEEEKLKPYPLHLGVTEAGDGEDGRIKSSVGIGALLEDGLGDTIRVSLTEAPEAEAPVAQKLIDRYANRKEHAPIKPVNRVLFNPFAYERRASRAVLNFGGSNPVPRVLADWSHVDVRTYADLKPIGHFYLPATDKWHMNDQGADYLYTGMRSTGFMLPNGLKEIRDYTAWLQAADKLNVFPMFSLDEYQTATKKHNECNFIKLSLSDLNEEVCRLLVHDKRVVVVASVYSEHAMAEFRRFFLELREQDIDVPVVVTRNYHVGIELMMLHAATDLGSLFVDGFGDGIMLSYSGVDPGELAAVNRTAFGILQATRNRMSKTEYISCPSCGRTLFDLQETTAMIRGRTEHLKGVKIGIMGCIVNGPGEMADADYGYVGSGPGRITLYRGKEVVKRNVPAAQAVDEMINLIREDGLWIEKQESNVD